MEVLSNKYVIVGMSGGVDSSVAALLLKQQGYHVEGLFMKNWEEDDQSQYCTAQQDFQDAQNVCNSLKIKLHFANFSSEYWDNVFTYFLEDYKNGRTPNPDILCNREIKFKAFLDYALFLKADFIATGHYAKKITTKDGKIELHKARDLNKDQTYFLYSVNQSKIAKTLFPLGNILKSEVRYLAKKHKLITYNKKDSTGICFIGERRFRDFLQQYLPAQPGNIETIEGNAIGRHNGLMYHTLGQRQGLGIGGQKKNIHHEPWYVIDKNLQTNTLIVGQGQMNDRLLIDIVEIKQLYWISPELPTFPIKVKAKVRYRQSDQTCLLMRIDADQYQVRFTHEQRAVAPGQSIVFYQENQCLGGAVIERSYKKID